MPPNQPNTTSPAFEWLFPSTQTPQQKKKINKKLKKKENCTHLVALLFFSHEKERSCIGIGFGLVWFDLGHMIEERKKKKKKGVLGRDTSAARKA